MTETDGKICRALGLEVSIFVKMTVLLKAIYRFSVYVLSRVWLFVTPVTLWNFSRQEYWSGLPFPTSGDFSDPGIKFASPALEAEFFTAETPGKPSTF